MVQPPWQPGNILSYPGNQNQFQALQPGLVKLSQDETLRRTGLRARKHHLECQSGTNTTTSTSSNYSFDASNSFTGGDIAGFYAR